MLRIVAVLACSALLGACTVVDFAIGRENCPHQWELGSPAGYAEIGWPANDQLLSLDLFGGPNGGTLISADVWRLLHLELGLLGLGLGVGPFQVGGGIGFYRPDAPAMMQGACPFMCEPSPASP